MRKDIHQVFRINAGEPDSPRMTIQVDLDTMLQLIEDYPPLAAMASVSKWWLIDPRLPGVPFFYSPRKRGNKSRSLHLCPRRVVNHHVRAYKKVI